MADLRETSIYILFDPRQPEVARYVGKSINIKTRILGHRGQAKARIHSHVYHWINKLWDEGVEFSYKVIEVVPAGQNWESREQHWISYYRELGHPLTNHTDGGEGQHGRKLSEESRKKMSEKKVGNKINEGREWSEESRNKAREAILGTRPNRPPGKTGFKYVGENGSTYYVRLVTPAGYHNKYGFKTAEEANEYVQEFLNQLKKAA